MQQQNDGVTATGMSRRRQFSDSSIGIVGTAWSKVARKGLSRVIRVWQSIWTRMKLKITGPNLIAKSKQMRSSLKSVLITTVWRLLLVKANFTRPETKRSTFLTNHWLMHHDANHTKSKQKHRTDMFLKNSQRRAVQIREVNEVKIG